MKKELLIRKPDLFNIGMEFLYDYDKNSALSFKNLQTSDKRLDTIDLLKSNFKNLQDISTDILDFLIYSKTANNISLEDFIKNHNIDKSLIPDLEKFISSYKTYKFTKGYFDTIDVISKFNDLLNNKCVRKDILENYSFKFELSYSESPYLIKAIIDKLTVN